MPINRYTRTAIALHWLIALLIFTLYPLGLIMSDMPNSPERIQYISWHKWGGVTVLWLVVLRMVWRMTHTPPALQSVMPLWQQRVSRLVHFLLYISMLAVPVTGWLMSSAKGFTVNYFGWFNLPDLIMKDKELGHLLGEWHEFFAHSLMILVGLHVLAAFKHQWVDKDRLLARMAWGWSR